MLTDKQLEKRRGGIGGSDMHHILSEPPYGCARQLWYEKRGTVQDHPFVATEVMDRGNDLEPFVIKYYKQETGRKVRGSVTRVHSKFKQARGNVDSIIYDVKGKDGDGVLECKVPGSDMFRKVREEGLLTSYILQLQWYLYITGLKWGSYALLCPEKPYSWYPAGFMYFDFDRDDKLIAQMEAAAIKFWRSVEHGGIPDRLDPTDPRCKRCSFRTTCQGSALLEMVPTNGKIDLDDSIKTPVERFIEAKQIFADSKDLLESRKQILSDSMGDRAEVECDGYRVMYKPQITNRFNSILFKKENKKLYDKYKVESVSRPLKVYEK